MLVETQNGRGTMEKSLAVSYKFKHMSNYTSRCLPQRNEDVYPYRTYTWMFIIVLFVTAKNCEQWQWPSAGEWTSQLWYIHCNGTLLSNKKKPPIDKANNMNESQTHCRSFKKLNWKGSILLNSIYMTLQKRQNYWNRNQ